MEDSLVFSYYYGHFRPLSSIFSSHVGQNYLTVPPYFFAWLFSWCDVRLQPWLYQWWGFCWAVAGCSVIFFSGMFRSRAILLIGPSVLGLLGVNDIYYWNTLIYTMYTGLLVLFGLFFYPPPKTWGGSVIMALFFVVLPWSGPYSVLLIPVSLLHFLFVRDWKKNIPVLLGLCSTVAYFTTVQSQTARFEHLQPWVVIRYLHVLLEKVVLFQLLDGVPLYWGFVVVLLLFLSLYFFRQDPDYVRNLLFMLCLITASLTLFFLSVKFPLYGQTLACHRLISLFFWLVLLLYISDRLLVLYRPPRYVAGAIVTFFFVVVTVANIRFPSLGHARPIPGVQEFVRAIAWYERVIASEPGRYVELHLPTYLQLMQPRVRVGNQRPDARPLENVRLPDPAWKRFLVRQ